jgi:hypothetical protein
MSNTPATTIVREQDDTIPIMHKTLTMFFFRTGYIQPAVVVPSAFFLQEIADFYVNLQFLYHTFYFVGW